MSRPLGQHAQKVAAEARAGLNRPLARVATDALRSCGPRMGAVLLGLAGIVVSPGAWADEVASPIGGVLDSTTLSGQVDTSGPWNPGPELTSIPEPASWQLAIAGGVLWLLVGRPRRSS